MKIVVAGGTGFIGGQLVERLVARGDEVFVLTRRAAQVRAGHPLVWDGRTTGAWAEDVASADAVVNLAGENIAGGRWTPERKQMLLESRLRATRALVDAIRKEPARKRVFVNASAIGIYGNRGDEEVRETSSRGSGFLADLVTQWEGAARDAEPVARLVILRFGIVLARDGGALGKMLLPFKLGAGGPIASGNQWMSWIDRDDVIRMIEWTIDREDARGIYNATAPAPVRSRDFAHALGRALHRPAFLPVPSFALRLLFGEMADETLIGGQRVLPQRAEAEGFRFEAPSLADSLMKQL
jgi:uncharacterized protein (TIGR01777 family)